MLEEIGYQGQLKLKQSKICVVGVGGLGNPIVTRLAAMGVGKIRIVDRDVIELSNLHRQTMFNEDDVGQVKVETAARKLRKLNADIVIEEMPVSINDYTAFEVVDGCDVVVDALDSVNARYSLNKACIEKKSLLLLVQQLVSLVSVLQYFLTSLLVIIACFLRLMKILCQLAVLKVCIHQYFLS